MTSRDLSARRLTSGRLRASSLVAMSGDAAAGAVALAATVVVAADSGGYFPASWDVGAAAFAWLALLGLILRPRIGLGRGELRFLAALAGLLVWNLVSAAWAGSLQAPLLDAQRTLMYLAFAVGLIVASRAGAAVPILVGAAVGGFGVSMYALLSRLRPDLLGLHDDPVAKGRLYQPIGYWNALGIFATMTALLALGCAMRARAAWVRAAAAAAVPPLAVTVYFTYSRGSMLVSLVAIGLGLALDRRRLRSLTAALATAPWAAVAVVDASTRGALGRSGVGTVRAAAAGRPVLVIVTGCALASAATVYALARIERRVVVTPRLRTGYLVGLGVVALALLTLALARFGTPQHIVVRAVEDMGARPVVAKGNESARLSSLSLNGRPALWRSALSDFASHPLAGSGAGTFEQYWLQHRSRIYVSRYAHSIYLESLAEGGVIRLLILGVMLAVPLLAAVRLRSEPHVLTAFGAYAAYLLHAGFDWDWEMPAVTVVALACAVAILVAARREGPSRLRLPLARPAVAGACLATLAVAIVCWHGNDALAQSSSAQGRGDWPSVERNARIAVSWVPWSDSGDLALAAALVHRRDFADARGVLRQATRRDPVDWAAWQRLADVTKGPAHDRALARAEELNPKGMRRLLRLRVLQARGSHGAP